MIRYALRCDSQHGFESWFPDSDAFERQNKRGLVTCPVCGSTRIEKSIMAPRIARNRKTSKAPAPMANETVAAADASPVPLVSAKEQEFRAKLRELRDHLVSQADNVGSKFPEEARKMHYGEIEHRPIVGEATKGEAQALHEEGVEFFPLPVLPDERN
jgi:hypothetical protein